MKAHHLCISAVLVATASGPLSGAEKSDGGFVPMFNGKDLSGWVNVNCAPGTFFVRDGEIITTGKPTGFLRTARQYENFIAEFEWMHVNKTEAGNSGFFVWADPIPAVGTPYTRAIEVQVLVNLEKEGYYTSQGDLFSIHGATCKPDRPHPHGWARCLPSENRCKGGGEWNHYKVVANNGVVKLHVNGKEVSGVSECNPRKGYLALESEGAECHFRNLKIKELPSTNPKPTEVADQDEGFQNLFIGLDLTNWKADQAAKRHWQPRDWILHYDGKGGPLSTEKQFGDAEFVVDYRFPKRDARSSCDFVFHHGNGQMAKVVVASDGKWEASAGAVAAGRGEAVHPAGQWNRLRLKIQGGSLQVRFIGDGRSESGSVGGVTGTGSLTIRPEGEMDFANLFVRERK